MNTPAEYARVSEVYAAVFDLPREQRQRKVIELCGGDEELRRWVEDLLVADEAVQAADSIRGGATASDVAAAAFGLPREQRNIPAGTMAAGRYRIASLIGRGGSGEVYAAEDLLLQQTVALKFLAASLNARARAAALLEEVRLARRVRHPNVCQVFDVGEAEGERFVSMEYVRGPNLAEEIRRMGRFAAPKAVHVAQQLCAGLMAIHSAGIVHGDLKPANVMLDERGDVRILDFGISVARDTTAAEKRLLGTPAYLAPERWGEGGATIASDIYALGLVLYEIFTGVRAVVALDPAAYRSEHEERVPPHPSSVAADLDGTVESIIERCLAKDPAQRPQSVLEVARALPGGDALGALVLAGVVPTPERVAEGGREARLSRPLAVALGLVFVALLGIAAVLMPRVHLVEGTDLPVAPVALADRASGLLRDVGYPPLPYHAYGFGVFNGEADLLFWYRGSPRALVPNALESSVALVDPPFTEAGMVGVVLAPSGVLRSFVSVGPDPKPVEDEQSELRFLFQRAGLDFERFRPVPPAYGRFLHRGKALAWSAVDPPLRVEASTAEGRVVYFEVIEAGQTPLWAEGQPRADSRRAFGKFTLMFAAVALAGAALLAQGNFRRGVVDRLGARRTAVALLVLGLAHGGTDLLSAGTPSMTLRFLFFIIERAALFASAAWIFYAALEPFFRRYWPHALVSWTRLVRGRFLDPVLGRDVLVGACIGCLALISEVVEDRLSESFGGPPHLLPTLEQLAALSGAWGALGAVLAAALGAVVLSWVQFSLLVLLRRLLGAGVVKIIAFALLVTAGNAFFDPQPLPALAVQFVFWLVAAPLFVRYGFSAMVTAAFVFLTMTHLPTTLDPTQWYFPTSVAGFALLLALVGAATWASIAEER